MMKNNIYAILIGIIICFSLIIALFALASTQKEKINTKNFPLEIDLTNNVFNMGEKITFTAIITNKSGRAVNVSSNGEMPCAFFHHSDDTINHGETTVLVEQVLKANEQMSRVFEYVAIKSGTYVLDVHYSIEVDGVELCDSLGDIFIEVK
jgi:ligand-binding SRPBCC domain-containing protein